MARDISADQPFDRDDLNEDKKWVPIVLADIHGGQYIRCKNVDSGVRTEGPVQSRIGTELKLGRSGNITIKATGWTFEVLK